MPLEDAEFETDEGYEKKLRAIHDCLSANGVEEANIKMLNGKKLKYRRY